MSRSGFSCKERTNEVLHVQTAVSEAQPIGRMKKDELIGESQPWFTASPGKGSWRDVPAALCRILRRWWSQQLFPGQAYSEASREGESRLWPVLLVAIAGSLLFCNLSYPLLEPDEGRYAEVTREMLTSGDWIVPTLNGQPFYDKPPLFYWLGAASFRLFGTTEWAARFVPALAAFFTVCAVFALGRRSVGARPSFLAALGLALTVGFIQIGRIVILDSLLTLFVTLSLLTALEVIRRQTNHWPWWVASSICCALGVLTKGPIALVLVIPPVVAYSWLNRDTARLTLAHWGVFAGLVLGLSAPWYVAIIARDPKFAYYFFVDQHLVRFWMKEYHAEPMWYYVPVLLVGCLPWSFLFFPFIRFLFSRSADIRRLRQPELGYFLLWAGWVVLFFSLSSGKLPPYMLPAMPAIALMIGCYLDCALFQRSAASLFPRVRRLVPRLVVVALLVTWLVTSVVAWQMHLISAWEACLQVVLCIGLMIGLALWGKRLEPRAAWAFCAALGGVLIFETAHDLVPAWSSRRSPLTRYPDIAESVRESQVPVVCYGAEWGSIPFYLGNVDHIINWPDVPIEELQQRLSNIPRYLMIVRHREDLERLRRCLRPGKQITRMLSAHEIGIALVETDARLASH
jgi:dolichol-phosphate mannosyltransferase